LCLSHAAPATPAAPTLPLHDALPIFDRPGGTRLVIAAGDPLGPEEQAVIAAGAMVLGLEVHGSRNEDQREIDRWSRLTDALLDGDRKSTRLNSSHVKISYAVFCLKKK